MDHFSREEFACRCGCGLNLLQDSLSVRIDAARGYAGMPFVVNSGTRCPKYNRAVGGSPDSAHLTGHAADIRGVTSRERFAIVKALVEAGFTRIGVYPWGVHCDTDPTKDPEVMWVRG